MENINKTTLSGLATLAVLALAVSLMPAIVQADTPGYVTPYGSTKFNNNVPVNNGYNYYVPNPAPVYNPTYSPTPVPPPAPAPIVNSNGQTVNQAGPQAGATTTEATGDPSLSASASSAGGSFFPSSLVQWILFAILLILIFILTRKVFGREEKYLAVPLKHS